jgi:alpha-beta hydrolase superfamily lysophospholipase
MAEHAFTSDGGTQIFYRSWRPAAPNGRVLVLFHRGHEHSGRWAGIVEDLAPEGFSVFAWDARGNGRSEGPRDDAESFTVYAKDADLFVRHVAAQERIAVEDMAVVAHSVGAAVAAAWVHDFAPRIRALVLATPAFRIHLYVPFAIPSLRLAQKLGLMPVVPSYVKASVLTHDDEQRREHEKDELITHSISTRVLIDLFDTATRLIEDAGAIDTPTLVLTSGSDWVTQSKAAERFFERLGSPVKVIERLPGFYHDIYHETDRARPLRLTREFVERSFASAAPRGRRIDADRAGYTFEEHRRLSATPGILKGAQFGTTRLMMRGPGRLSQGIRLGYESGFNSGRTLDYVYRNQPTGTGPIGRLIDRTYLESIGWKGIRIRKNHLRRLLEQAIGRAHETFGRAHVVDIAGGAGRYLLETLKAQDGQPTTALIRDFEPKNLEEGRATARALGVTAAEFAQGDAFDEASLAALAPRPNVGIVSGLYELFSDNEAVLRSLRGLARAIPAGGSLVYTNQPWHPQLELIARTLCDWDGKPWVMRRRTQAEMDDLVREAGFRKEAMEIDRWGIFTVSVARREG